MENERYVIDRFEDNGWAVLEHPDGSSFNVPVYWLPEAAMEGDVLKVETDLAHTLHDPNPEMSGVYFVIDREETERRRQAARDLRSRLRRGPEGDIQL
jgi:hypothetical protein